MRVLLPLAIIVVLALVVVRFGAMVLEQRAVGSQGAPDGFTPQELPQFKQAPPSSSRPPSNAPPPNNRSPSRPRPGSPETPETFRG